MKALIVYTILVIVGAIASGLLGLWIENAYSSGLGLIVFLTLFFANFAGCWIITILIMDGTLKRARG